MLQLRQPKGSSASKKGGFGGVGFVMQQAIVILVLSNVVFGICVGLHEVSYESTTVMTIDAYIWLLF